LVPMEAGTASGNGTIVIQTRLDHDTRQRQIVEAAREIIAAGGTEALTVNAIAARVGVSEAALYRHVQGKDEVLLLLVDDIRESLFEEISRATGRDGAALEKLEHLLQLHLSYVESRQGISFVVIAEALQFVERGVGAAVKRLVDDYLEFVEGIVEDGQLRGEIHPDVEASAAATAFFGMVQAKVMRWLFDAKKHPLTESASALWGLFRAGLTAPREYEAQAVGTGGSFGRLAEADRTGG